MDEISYEILLQLRLEYITLIKLPDFEDKELVKVKPTRTHGEYCWTCTPSLPLYIFKNFPDIKTISYVDSDLYFYSSPYPIFREFGNDAILIIPHRFSSKVKEREKNSGVYNVGMMIFRKNKSGLECLTWWRKQCLAWCYNRIEKDKLGDQKYLEKFPLLFKKVHTLKHIGAGVGTWNIRSYKVWKNRGKVFINDVPLIFYHFVDLEIYPPKRFLLAASLNGYGEITVGRKLIYEQYFRELYSVFDLVKRIDPLFSFGFSPRPALGTFLKEELLDKTIRFFGT